MIRTHDPPDDARIAEQHPYKGENNRYEPKDNMPWFGGITKPSVIRPSQYEIHREFVVSDIQEKP